jgi:hypothetical protein
MMQPRQKDLLLQQSSYRCSSRSLLVKHVGEQQVVVRKEEMEVLHQEVLVVVQWWSCRIWFYCVSGFATSVVNCGTTRVPRVYLCTFHTHTL